MIKKVSIIFCCFVLCLSSMGFAPAESETISSKARILMDYHTGKVLSECNSKAHLPIASVTKLTTMLLCFEALERGELSLEESLTASEYASSMGGSQVFIDANADYSVLSLLHAVAIASANDASVVLAERIAGSEENFVSLMNERVVKLGGQDTNYTNCTGLPSPMAFSCAYDVALVMREVVKHDLFHQISTIKLEDFSHPSGRTTQMANTNKLLSTYAFCDGGKTGSTNEAKFCMSATAIKGDMRLISVVLGASSSALRFSAVKSMFEWGFSNFTTKKVLPIEEHGVSVRMAKSQAKCVPVCEFVVTLLKNEDVPYCVTFTFDDLSAPLASGEKVGKAIITENGVVIDEIDLVLVSDVEALGIFDLVRHISKQILHE